MKIGLLHTGIRGDEKLIIDAANDLGTELDLIDVRKVTLNNSSREDWDADIYIERCISTTLGTAMTNYLEEIGKPVLNPVRTGHVCESKFLTTLRLQNFDIPVADASMVFTESGAKKEVERLGGYPCVVKSDSGSWGRLMTKVNDQDSLEGIVEHKQFLGGVNHKAVYVQEYIDKPQRDIRVFIFGGEAKAAIYRNSEHWITNTARGATTDNCEVTEDIQEISDRIGQAFANEIFPDGGVLAIDLLEDPSRGLVVNEVNHTMEFKNSEKPTGVSISGEIIKYCINYVSSRK